MLDEYKEEFTEIYPDEPERHHPELDTFGRLLESYDGTSEKFDEIAEGMLLLKSVMQFDNFMTTPRTEKDTSQEPDISPQEMAETIVEIKAELAKIRA